MDPAWLIPAVLPQEFNSQGIGVNTYWAQVYCEDFKLDLGTLGSKLYTVSSKIQCEHT